MMFIFTLLVSLKSFAAESQGAVVTRVEGEVDLLILKKDKNEKAPAGTQNMQIDKDIYFKRAAKKGDRPANGDIIKTDKNGKARLIFRNGDQVTVTSSTAYRFSWDKASDKNAVAEVLFGDIRAVIQPGGPRSGMKVKTKSTVMGVRGTDFYVASWSKEGATKVAVMRGKVAVADAKAGLEKAVEVSTGMTGAVSGQKTETPVVQATTKQDLIVLEHESKVKKVAAVTVEEKKAEADFVKLEEKAVEVTLEDIKKEDPTLYAELKAKKNLDADNIQTATVKKLFNEAPSSDKSYKPNIEDLDNGDDVYDRYKWKR